jgi:acyl-CoA thioesterase I
MKFSFCGGVAAICAAMVLAFATISQTEVATAAAPAAGGKVRVACIGASITFGAGVENREKNCYPAQMQNLLGAGYDVRNYGVSGCTMLKKGDSPYWNQKAYKESLDFNPNVLVIDLGGNDSKPQNWKFKAEFAADTRAMIDSFRALPAKPRVLVCLPMPAFKVMWGINDEVITKELTPILRQVAGEAGVEVVDLHTPFLDKQAWFADNVHPNAQGAALMAKIIGDAIAARPASPKAAETASAATAFLSLLRGESLTCLAATWQDRVPPSGSK